MTYEELQRVESDAQDAVAAARRARLKILVPFKKGDTVDILITKTSTSRYGRPGLTKGTTRTITIGYVALTSQGKNATINFTDEKGYYQSILTDKFEWI